jgi:hypothetical protein
MIMMMMMVMELRSCQSRCQNSISGISLLNHQNSEKLQNKVLDYVLLAAQGGPFIDLRNYTKAINLEH